MATIGKVMVPKSLAQMFTNLMTMIIIMYQYTYALTYSKAHWKNPGAVMVLVMSASQEVDAGGSRPS